MFGLFSKSGSRSKQATGVAPTRSLQVEALENRLTPASVSVASGQLWIYGTGNGDNIRIERETYMWTMSGPIRNITVYDNNVAIASVRESSLYNRDIIVYGYGGNDTIRNNTALDLIAYGGWGHDDIFGGSGHDFLVGEGDTDRLYGRDGSDTLIGGWYGQPWYDYSSDYLQGDDWGRNWWVDYFGESDGWYPGWDAGDTNGDFAPGFDQIFIY